MENASVEGPDATAPAKLDSIYNAVRILFPCECPASWLAYGLHQQYCLRQHQADIVELVDMAYRAGLEIGRSHA